MADSDAQRAEAQQQDSSSNSNLESSSSSLLPDTADTPTSSIHAPSPHTDDPAAPGQPQPQRRSKRWPAYFFPSLAVQRTSFCLDVLRREDIKSVCEVGCGQGAVLRPMTNAASHIDSFPEAIFDEASLMAEEAEDNECEVSIQEAITGADLTDDPASMPPAEDDDEDSLAPSESASRRHSLDDEPGQGAGSDEVHATSSDSRGRSPPRGRQGGTVVDLAHRAPQFCTPEPVASTSKLPLNTQILEKYKKLPGPRVQDKELHLRRIAGLDFSHDSLLEAIEATAPPPEEPSPFFTYFSYSNRDRWEDLRVELWQGSLDVYNDALDNFEAFIMTEVIEHLHERQLNKFPEILFGSYRPRIIVITTPNYDFNRFFSKAKQTSADEASRDMGEKPEDETKNSFKDPTGRTDRYFRDDDHKFEWTEKEFKDWCEMITSEYDYSVEYSGVGSLRNYFGKGGMHALSEPPAESTSSSTSSSRVPPPHIQEMLDSVPDPSKMYATQTAVFRRKFAYESERSPRSPMQMPLAFYGVKPVSKRPLSASPSSTSSGLLPGQTTARRSAKQRSHAADPESDSSASRSPDKRHKLLKAHYFKACPQAGNAKSSKAIRGLLDDLMRDRMRARSASLRELWGRNEVAQACGGYVNKLIQALVKDADCKWDLEFVPSALEKGGAVEDAVQIILTDFTEPERPSYKALEGAEEEDDDVKEPYVNHAENSDDSDRENASSKDNDGDEEEGQVITAPAQLSKRQKKLKRIEEAPFLAPIFPLEDEAVWMPEPGTEDAQVWAQWTDPARAATMISEEQWAQEVDEKHGSGWD